MKRLRLLVSKPCLTVALLLLYQTPLMAQEGRSTESADTDRAPPAAVSLSDLLDMPLAPVRGLQGVGGMPDAVNRFSGVASGLIQD